MENAKPVSLHFTLKLEGPREKVDEVPIWSPAWHAVENVSWSTGFCIKPTSKRWV